MTKSKQEQWEREFERFNKQWEKEGYLSIDELKQFIRQQRTEAKREAVENISKDLKKWSKYSGMGVATLFDRKYLK